MEFRLLNFSSANIKPSETAQLLQSTNVAGTIPVTLGSTAQSILFSQLLNWILLPVKLYSELFL